MESVIGILMAKVKLHFFFLISSEISCAFPLIQILATYLLHLDIQWSFLEIARKYHCYSTKWKWTCKSLSHVWLFVTPWTTVHKAPLSMGVLQARKLECVCHILLQGLFPTRGLNPGLLHDRQILYHLSHWQTHRYSIHCFKFHAHHILSTQLCELQNWRFS